jgi:D-apiose dehydrogenase
MKNLRVAVAGCGFWSRFQVPAWQELSDVECVAVCDVEKARAQQTARAFGIEGSYSDAAEMIKEQRPDVLDVITSPSTHRQLVELAASTKTPVICQKPMANELSEAKAMVRLCEEAQIPFLVHENWRWQRPIRELKRSLDSERIGTPFRARLDFNTSFPVFTNQPFLRELRQFILADVGTHVLDVARFLFGEAKQVVCQIQTINPGIAGEDVATVLLEMRNGMTVICNLSCASRTENERFPETFILVEATNGSVELAPNFSVRLTDIEGTFARRCPSPTYCWADPDYALVHASIVECHRNLRNGLLGTEAAETTGVDNLRTLELVFGAYQSAQQGTVVDNSESAKLARRSPPREYQVR